MNSGFIKVIVVGSQQLNPHSQYRKSVSGVSNVKVELFSAPPNQEPTKVGKPKLTDADGIVLFENLYWGFYFIRINDDIYGERIVSIDPRTGSPDVSPVKFEVNV